MKVSPNRVLKNPIMQSANAKFGFKECWEQELLELDRKNLRRRTRERGASGAGEWAEAGRTWVNLASNDYLGFSRDPRLTAAASAAALAYGAGSGASRLMSGSLDLHRKLEEAIAAFLGEEAALYFTSGYQANVGVLSALLGPGDWAVLDRLSHASLVDGARLSGAKLKVYGHRDVVALKKILANRPAGVRALVVTESYFSMDGTVAPLRKIWEICRKYHAGLLVDEAHALGVFGARGAGLLEEAGLQGKVDVVIGTLSKAGGVFGGFAAGSRALREILVNRAKAFIYSTAPSPILVGAAIKAVELLQAADSERQVLKDRVDTLRSRLITAGYDLGDSTGPIIPIRVNDTAKVLALSAQLKEAGFIAPAIRPPTVPKNTDRLRLTVTAVHRSEDLERLAKLLTQHHEK